MSSRAQASKFNPRYELYDRPDYYNALAEKIAKTKKSDRVVIATMTFSLSDPLVRRIMHELYAASDRGASVYMLVDALTFITHKGLVPKYPLHLKRWAASTRSQEAQSLQKLAELGGHYSILNWPGKSQINPFAHRSHLKFAVVGNDVFLGGANLTSSKVMDCVVGWKDAASADWLSDLATKMAITRDASKALNGHDVVFPISGSSQILLDAGVKKQSIILEKALEFVDEAKEEVWITSQFFPGGRMARHLSQAAARGVRVRILYNNPAKHDPPIAAWQRAVVSRARKSLPADLFAYRLPKESGLIHAKVLVTEKKVIIGSHNYLERGVTFGTAEIALLSDDAELRKQTLGMLHKFTKPSVLL
jgi:phosphatidylserine/phosphatidylglycerophosphate/cardiolipin synthase-like enzyme